MHIKELLFLLIIILFKREVNLSSVDINKNNLNKTQILYYEKLFNSIEYDYYNLSLIYNNPNISIKIKHKSNKNIFNKVICIFGILVNDQGLLIENSMLNWLIPEYDVYCIYQKYPGILFEYPALRFAQWFSKKNNISFILYIHTKGAYNKNKIQEQIRLTWKHEFTNPRNKIYINLIKNNLTDIASPFRYKKMTWYNGMFISLKAFKLIPIIQIYKNRYYYESLFKINNNIRFKGILNDSISIYNVSYQNSLFARYFAEIDKKNNNNTILLCYSSIIIIIIIFHIKRKKSYQITTFIF